MNTYIHLFNLVGKPLGSFHLGTIDETIRTAECEYCPCVMPGEVASWLERAHLQMFHWVRAPAPFQRFISGSFHAGPLPGFFFVSSQKSGAGFMNEGRADARALWLGLEREGHRWHPEPVFTGDGDKHHG